MHAIVDEVLDVGVATQKPQQLIYHTLEEQTLCSDQRKALAEVEAHLITKDALCSRTCSVATHNALAAYLTQQLLILSHLCRKF